MAIVTFPPGDPGFNTSQGGSNFSQNRAGFYIKSRKKGLVFNTPVATIRRTNFRNVVQRWKLLGSPYHSAWLNKAADRLRTNTLGLQYYLTPFQYFVSLNTARVNQGFPIADLPPFSTYYPAVFMSSLIMDIDPLDLSFDFFPHPVPADVEYRIWTSNIISDGYIPVWPKNYKWIATLLPGTTQPFVAGPSWQAVYGYGPSNMSGIRINWAIYIGLEAYWPAKNRAVLKFVDHASIIT